MEHVHPQESKISTHYTIYITNTMVFVLLPQVTPNISQDISSP